MYRVHIHTRRNKWVNLMMKFTSNARATWGESYDWFNFSMRNFRLLTFLPFFLRSVRVRGKIYLFEKYKYLKKKLCGCAESNDSGQANVKLWLKVWLKNGIDRRVSQCPICRQHWSRDRLAWKSSSALQSAPSRPVPSMTSEEAFTSPGSIRRLRFANGSRVW